VTAAHVKGVAGRDGPDPRRRAVAPGRAAAAAGMTKEVTFEPVDGPINDRIDDACHAKYHGSPCLAPTIAARARSATIRVMPRETTA